MHGDKYTWEKIAKKKNERDYPFNKITVYLSNRTCRKEITF